MREHYQIITPENVAFDFEKAGFFSRFLAWIMDIALIAILTWILSMGVSALSLVGQGFASALWAVVYFVVNWGYFVFLEWFLGGQSLGKKALGLRVLSDDGVRITLQQSAIRNLFRVLDGMPLMYLLGGSVAFWSAQGKRFGDMAAGTIVVQERSLPLPEAIVPPRERFNSFVRDPEVLRQVSARITAQERDLLLDLALRRERLPLARRLQLFSSLADHLEERLGVSRPAFFSDERYCLNLAAVLLQSGQDSGDSLGRR